MPPAEPMTQEIINRLKERIRLQRENGGDYMTYGRPDPLDVEILSTLTNLTPSGVERAGVTPPNIWGGNGFTVADATGDDGKVEMGAVPRWHVSVEGVGSFPIAYFYEEADARFWAQAAIASLALPSEPPSQGDVE